MTSDGAYGAEGARTPRAPHGGERGSGGGVAGRGGPGGRRGPGAASPASPAPPAAPVPPAPDVPPMPRRAPEAEPALHAWLRAPRPEAGPGVWRHGHRPRPSADPAQSRIHELLGGLCGALVWVLAVSGHLPPLMAPLGWLTPASLWRSGASVVVACLYYALLAVVLAHVFRRLGRKAGEVWWRHVRPRPGGVPPERGGRASADPADWPRLRAAGEHAAADRLAAELRAGRMNDVDCARIDRAWQAAGADPSRRAAFAEAVLSRGAAAFAHPSGQRDLPVVRAARHDLLTGQVRLGTVPDEGRNPYAYRGAHLALEPALLGTSLLVVGPSASGKTGRVVRPVVESLSLQALAGRAAVVAVGAAGADLGPDAAYDVVLRPGRPGSAPGLDLYGGLEDPDEAAAVLAEALAGDGGGEPAGAAEGSGAHRAAAVLAQLLGPYRAAHGRFPSVPELRELLEGVPVALAALRTACEAAGDGAALRELDARERQAGRPGDAGPLLADRIALLDRPAFAGSFGGGAARPFCPRDLEHPLRVRVELPERGPAETSRLLVRLLLAQFTAWALSRGERSRFACLVLDDAAGALTPASVGAIQRLRAAHAGVVLALRGLDEVPEPLRAAVVGAVGCRAVLSGVSTWDGEVFAQAWGREWVRTEDVTHAPSPSGGLLRRGVRGVYALFTGVRAADRSVTVRTVQRERWSASDLAHRVPPGHAVVSLASVRGEASPPVLTRLGE